MRLAELIMAIGMGALSIYLMVKSAELPIGWIPGEGPGGGAFPFWLSSGMLLCCISLVVRWIRKTSPLSKSTEIYMSRKATKQFMMAAGALAVTIALFKIVGVYVALPLFIMFYMHVNGQHSWRLKVAVAAAVDIVAFFFFEIALNITLPKGVTEPLFYPLYDIFL